MEAQVLKIINFMLPFILAPLIPGIINRTKAFFAGRKGQPVLQAYHDLFKLMGKDRVYSKSSGIILRIGHLINLSCIGAALTFIPGACSSSFFEFRGDIIFVIYLLALGRFFTVLAALDTASSFEGMGSSREVQFAALSEPALLICVAALACLTNSFSVSGMTRGISGDTLVSSFIILLPLASSLFLVFLSENCRVPFDDPNTHLELTMIHEVMVLDYSGPDLGAIFYASYLKLWVLGAIISSLIFPTSGLDYMSAIPVFISGMIFIGILTGVAESAMARFRFVKIPQILVGALCLAITGFMLLWR